ncbi:MAG TPA: bifunctional (p)ppGpp synthetase/guanosine-3',5'-bis(diphosphate) 3'-pyrophosphohydrolase [Symbiobacteriaceae bacterium]|jgi:GTP pyrophosphokinase|nr:bifunctional (p)ppGpp synthetase/guanosine-3',5'-bis(diphosphate) 3'-pyrophosphohydrolase [Symbiobacteriaceae bacterium]
MAALDTLREHVMLYNPSADWPLIETAYAFAEAAHEGQLRKSGEPYITHPLAVAEIVAEMQLDVASIAAALLHDVIEDCEVSAETLTAKFGKEITTIVEGVTKLEKLNFSSRDEAQVENLRKMFLAMAKDLRVILIKLADRLHNMRTLKHRSPEAQRRIAEETMDIYAPLAHRLGVSEIKWELEDLSFRYMEPDRYQEMSQLVSRKRQERELLTNDLMSQLRERLDEAGIHADISGRPKHFFSIYKKIHRQGKDITQIYDLIAIRVIVDEVKDCYGALGVIHSQWKPLPLRFKDYIATPKPNMYQSLHTTVIGPHGEPFEIQIRTWEMHRTSEFGVAAHWAYKEGRTDREFDKKLQWLRSLLEWQQEMRDAREFVESVKVDIFADQVFVFSPKGHVFNLPADATPLDFAFAVHSDIGYRCVGAKVNGKISPLDRRLVNGDVVEILTSKQSPGPSIDWLKLVKTASAKNKIRQFFKKERRDENLARGRDILRGEVAKTGLEPHELLRPEWIEEVCKRSGVKDEEDLYLAIGVGAIASSTIVSRLRELYEREKKANEPPPPIELQTKDWSGYGRASNGIRVKGTDGLQIKFSRCCSPVPGDPVIGFVTRGRGITVHRMDCPNMDDLAKDPDRLIECAWEENYSAAHPVEVQITALDRSGLLADVVSIVAEVRINMLSVSSRAHKNKLATIDMVLEVKDAQQLQYIFQKVKKVRDVMTVERVTRERRAVGKSAT